MKRVVVTGASGFLGSRLIERLGSRDDLHVCAVVRRETSALTGADAVVVADLSAEGFEGALPDEADVLIHLAACHDSIEDDSTTIHAMVRLHVDAVARLLDWASARGVEHALMVSTTAVLEPGSVDAVLTEDAPCVATPTHPYALSRRQGEELARLYAGRVERVTVLRPSLVYGPGQGEESTVGRMGESLVMGEQVPLRRPDGHMVTPIYVDDVVDVMAWLVTEAALEPGLEVLNVAGPEHLSEGDLARALAEHLHQPLAFEAMHAEAVSFAVSSARLDALYPERPKTPWREGIARTWPD